MVLRGLSASAVALVVASCGASATDRKEPLSDTRHAAEQALKLWGRFAATASPRPIVPIEAVLDPNIGALSRYDPKTRRVSDPEAALAFKASRFALRVALPRTPSRFRGWRVISARRAFGLLLQSGDRGPDQPKMRLAITRAHLASGSFTTDRGLRTLPVWAFTVQGVQQPVRVLALPGSRVFMPPVNWDGENATVSGNGHVVRVAFVGDAAGDKPCDSSYTVGNVSNSHAVAFWLIDHPVKTRGSVVCLTIGYHRTVVIHLNRPLAGRVLVNSYGAPVPVCRGQRPPPVGGVIDTCRTGAN